MYLVEAQMAYEGSTLVGGRVSLEDAVTLAESARFNSRWSWHDEITITYYPEGDFDGYKTVEVVARLRIDLHIEYEEDEGYFEDESDLGGVFMFGGREPKGYYRRVH
jgi:hypothetical protein